MKEAPVSILRHLSPAQQPLSHTICFVDANRRVVSTFEMSTGKWTRMDPADDQPPNRPN